MRTKIAALLASALTLLAFNSPAGAAVVDFTGGAATLLNGAVVTTNNSGVYQSVDYYEENGFRLDFSPNSGSAGFSTNIGDYYGVRNDVIHAHWEQGVFGLVEAITITKIGGGLFDLNYFILTSNTDTGGAPASGSEKAYVEGFAAGVSTGKMLLPSENWGFPATQIFLDGAFDAVDVVKFFVMSDVDCFGMDEFFIDEPAPPPNGVPEPASGALLSIALAGLLLRRRWN